MFFMTKVIFQVDLFEFKFCQNNNVPPKKDKVWKFKNTRLLIFKKREIKMNLNEECLLKYLQNPNELVDLTSLLVEFNANNALYETDQSDNIFNIQPA